MDDMPGDAEWRTWLEALAPQFLLFARQKARCEADAQDLVQESVLEASERSRQQIPAPALVFATIRRRAIDWARREDRRNHRESTMAEASPEPWFDTSIEDRERAQVIQGALKQLPEIFREVLLLKIWGELTFAEIGDALNISPNTAASRYRYGLEELRKAQVLV